MHCRSEGLGSVVLRLENIFIDIIIIFLGIYVTSISLIPLLQIHLGFFQVCSCQTSLKGHFYMGQNT